MNKLIGYLAVLLIGIGLGYWWNMSQWERAKKIYLQEIERREQRIERLVHALGTFESLNKTITVKKGRTKK